MLQSDDLFGSDLVRVLLLSICFAALLSLSRYVSWASCRGLGISGSVAILCQSPYSMEPLTALIMVSGIFFDLNMAEP